jgi:hypothetical protein
MAMLSRWTAIASLVLLTSCGGGNGERNSVLPMEPKIAATTPASDSTPVLFGSGTAAVDGVAAPGEWATAHCLAVNVNVPQGTTPGTVCAMNDQLNLYLLVRFARPAGDAVSVAEFDFDNDQSGWLTDGDDIILLAAWGAATSRFADDVSRPCAAGVCGLADMDLGGTTDGSGVFLHDGEFSTFELSHPLRSGDVQDFSLSAGDSIAFRLQFGFAPTMSSPRIETITSGRILVTVPIEIGREKINARSNAPIPVAVLSTPSFDAPASVDPDSLTFGRTGDEASRDSCRSRDMNGDGMQDLLCEFRTRAAGFEPEDTVGILKGSKLDGSPIAGVARVTTR